MNDGVREVMKRFERRIRENSLAHGYLLFGEGVEAIEAIAWRLAQLLERGVEGTDGGPLVDALAVRVNERGMIGIDEVRAMQRFLSRAPAISKRRMAVVHPADAMTEEAQSALLKIMEEPPQGTLVLLIARTPEGVMGTVRSRVHVVHVPSRIGSDPLKKGEEGASALLVAALEGLRKDIKANAPAVHEVMRRKMAVDRYNLNERLQLRVVDRYVEGLPAVRKKEAPKKRVAKKK